MVDSALKASLQRYFSDRDEQPDGEVVAAYLFGSAARGEAGEASDVDLGVLFRSPPASALRGPVERIADDLDRLLATPVEVVVLNTAPADLVHRVLRDGVLVCEHDSAMRVRFEVEKRREYLDLLPLLRRYRRGRRPTEAAGEAGAA